MKSLIILHSYHHNNTRKVAEAMTQVIDANIKSPNEIDIQRLHEFDLIGFGAGIDSGKHYQELLELADKLPLEEEKKCFIFSTSAVQGKSKVENDHKTLRDILHSKGYHVIGEFSCIDSTRTVFLSSSAA